jgi:cytochrome b561
MDASSTRETGMGGASIASNPQRTSFDGVMIAFHWATVAIVLGLLSTAVMHEQVHDVQTRVLLLRVHRSLGVTIWLLTVSRLLWRTALANLPPFPGHMVQIHRAVVTAGEYCLYGLLIIQPLTGFGATIARGRAFPLFWGNVPPLMPRLPALEDALFTLHQIGAWTLVVLITGHAMAALFHHFILRDETLARMLPVAVFRRHGREVSSDGGEAEALAEG